MKRQMINNVKVRQSTKGMVTTFIVEFYFDERNERPYILYVNTATDAQGLRDQLSGLARVIPPVVYCSCGSIDWYTDTVLNKKVCCRCQAPQPTA